MFDESRDKDESSPVTPEENEPSSSETASPESASDGAGTSATSASSGFPHDERDLDDDDSIEAAVEAIAAHPIFDMPPPPSESEEAEPPDGKRKSKPKVKRTMKERWAQAPAASRKFFLSRGFSQALGIVGESLITAGVVVMLFLGWQLWINDVIIFNESSAVAEKNIQKWTTTTTAHPTASGSAAPDYGPPPAMAAVDENIVFGNLYIPRFGNDYVKVVANGVSPEGTLNRGYFGHYPDSAWPGAPGNFAVAVHRAGHGSPFKAAPQLRVGDAVVLQTNEGYYEYQVRNTEYVLPTAVEVVNAIPGGSNTPVDGQSILTITTCNPELGNNERLITYAVLTGWRPKDAGPPASIAKMVTG